MPDRRLTVDEVLRKHSARLEKEINTPQIKNVNFSREYVRFKEEMAPELSSYERWCRSLGSIIKLKPSEKDATRIKRQLEIAHVDIEPWQALTLAVMSFLGVFFIGAVITLVAYLIYDALLILFFVLVLSLAVFVFYYTSTYPARLANKWRLKASSQMVPAILYVVVYMRHTSNLERAIAFSAEHLQYPLTLDFKKVFYDVEIGRFSTIKESLDNYLETWRDYSTEFIESFHLIESSLFEPDNARRIITLEKALQVILDGVYDKMLKFTHDVRAPLFNVYMLAVVLPVLGIALLPLASALIGDYLKWYHVVIFYNLVIPFIAFFLTNNIMMLRPGGHGETSLLERNPIYYKYASRKPYFTAFLVAFPLLIVGFLPLIFQYTQIPEWLGLAKDFTFGEIGLGIFGSDIKFFDFKAFGSGFVGPFGPGALIFSLFIPFGIAVFFSIAYSMKTKELIKERENTEQLEKELIYSLFQLGNRLGNGVPPELVFGKIAESARGLKTENFFRRVNYNIQQGGMDVEKAIFDIQRGAINYFPSDLIATSMRILIESAKKGLKIAAISLMSISEYMKNISKITMRLKDMLAEVISDMKSNMVFLAPLLSGIVVGLGAMITAILNRLDLTRLAGGEAAELGGNIGNLLNIFDILKMIPPYYLQITIGIYIIEVIFILTDTLVTIDAGEDKLQKTNQIGKNLSTGVLLYLIVSFVAIVALFFLASIVLGGLVG